MSVGSTAEEYAISEDDYIPVPQAIKLVPKSFDGNPRELREFIESVDAAYEVVNPSKHSLFLKFVEAKICGEAKAKLMIKRRNTWEDVRDILEEHYETRRTLDYHASKLFTSRQNSHETVIQWGSRIDNMASDLYKETRRKLEQIDSSYVSGGVRIMEEIVKVCFVQGLTNDRIKTIVRAKGENKSISQIIEIALEEESAILSQSYKLSNTVKQFSWKNKSSTAVAQNKKTYVQNATSQSKVNTESRPGTSGTIRKTCNKCKKVGHLAFECKRDILCYKCKKTGHYAGECRTKQGN